MMMMIIYIDLGSNPMEILNLILQIFFFIFFLTKFESRKNNKKLVRLLKSVHSTEIFSNM
jgi:hypothetical protein